jgi:hypothetical protein
MNRVITVYATWIKPAAEVKVIETEKADYSMGAVVEAIEDGRRVKVALKGKRNVARAGGMTHYALRYR